MGHKISAIIPTFNREAHVCDAIDSALRQTYPLYEIIVVDDGSTDNTIAVLAEKYGDRIRVIASANQGPAEARNVGIRESRGDWLAFLDSDDLWEPSKIEAQIGFVEANPDQNIGIVDTFSVVKDTRGNVVYRGILSKKGDSFRELLLVNVINGTPSVLMKKSCVADVGYLDPVLGGAEDHEYWLRVASRYSIYTIEQFLTVIRKHETNVSNNKLFMVENYKQFERIVIDRYRDRLNRDEINVIKAYRLQYAMIYHFKAREFRNFRAKMRGAIRLHPSIAFRIPMKHYLLYMASYL